jgi:hypothetical protein
VLSAPGTIVLAARDEAVREAAHRLYRRLGFVQRESDVFVWRPG